MLLFFFTSYSWRILNENVLKKKNKQQKYLAALMIIRYFSWAANRYIRMVSGGSFDTEQGFFFTGINYYLKYIKIQNVYFKLQ